MTLANQLTLARAFLGMLTFVCVWIGGPIFFELALALFVAATITDWVDGYIARKTHSVSPFGAIADPIADKVLIIGALIAFLRVRHLGIQHWAVFLIIVREMAILGLRTLAAVQGRLLSAEMWGKWKMGVQSGSVLAILVYLVLRDSWKVPMPEWMQPVPQLLVLLTLFVTWASAVRYLRQNRGLLRKSWNPGRPGDA